MTDEMRAKVEKVMKNLERNKMKPYFCENSEEAQALVKTLIKKGETISCGGSKTLDETGIYQMINSPDYNFLDRSAPGMTRPEVEEVYRQTFRADTFFMSTNALTENGELYNVDNLQTQKGYMYDIDDMAHISVNDEGVVYMYSTLYSDSASFKDEDVDILGWDDMISKANESIAAYYEKYQTRYGKIEFNLSLIHI